MDGKFIPYTNKGHQYLITDVGTFEIDNGKTYDLVIDYEDMTLRFNRVKYPSGWTYKPDFSHVESISIDDIVDVYTDNCKLVIEHVCESTYANWYTWDREFTFFNREEVNKVEKMLWGVINSAVEHFVINYLGVIRRFEERFKPHTDRRIIRAYHEMILRLQRVSPLWLHVLGEIDDALRAIENKAPSLSRLIENTLDVIATNKLEVDSRLMQRLEKYKEMKKND